MGSHRPFGGKYGLKGIAVTSCSGPTVGQAHATEGSYFGSVRGGTPVLFLDFDNSIHRCDAYMTLQGIGPSDPTATLFEFTSILESILRPYPSLQIVLSTSWVEALGYTEACDRPPPEPLRNRVVGATYDAQTADMPIWSTISRGQQILRYLRRHSLKHWLARDDMRAGFEGVESHLVHCQAGVGLGDKDVQAIFASRLESMFERIDTPPVAGASSDRTPS
jgi:hypothetical protein